MLRAVAHGKEALIKLRSACRGEKTCLAHLEGRPRCRVHQQRQRDQDQPDGHLHNLINASKRDYMLSATSVAGISAMFGTWTRHSPITIFWIRHKNQIRTVRMESAAGTSALKIPF